MTRRQEKGTFGAGVSKFVSKLDSELEERNSNILFGVDVSK